MSDIPLANWNGEELPLDRIQVSVMDRAFLFGDAIYEALRTYRGRMWLRAEHMQRLARSLREVRIETDLARLERRMEETLAHSGAQESIVYMQVTRGVVLPRAHAFPPPTVTPNELIYVQPLDGDLYGKYREQGAAVVTYADLRWKRCDVKSVNLLGNCLANQAAIEAGCAEAILVDSEGELTEGTHTSLFGVHDGKLLTSPTGPHILPGITRAFVLKLAERVGIPIVEQPLRKDALPDVDELFLCGTTVEVLPITQVDDVAIGTGRPGPVASRLYRAFQDAVAEWLGKAVGDRPSEVSRS